MTTLHKDNKTTTLHKDHETTALQPNHGNDRQYILSGWHQCPICHTWHESASVECSGCHQRGLKVKPNYSITLSVGDTQQFNPFPKIVSEGGAK